MTGSLSCVRPDCDVLALRRLVSRQRRTINNQTEVLADLRSTLASCKGDLQRQFLLIETQRTDLDALQSIASLRDHHSRSVRGSLLRGLGLVRDLIVSDAPEDLVEQALCALSDLSHRIVLDSSSTPEAASLVPMPLLH